jgi:hypothetical protein
MFMASEASLHRLFTSVPWTVSWLNFPYCIFVNYWFEIYFIFFRMEVSISQGSPVLRICDIFFIHFSLPQACYITLQSRRPFSDLTNNTLEKYTKYVAPLFITGSISCLLAGQKTQFRFGLTKVHNLLQVHGPWMYL